MNFKIIVLLVCLFSIRLSIAFSQANTQNELTANDWILIGKTEVDANDDHGAVTVPEECTGYKKIKFKISGPLVNINKLIVVYNSGPPQTLAEAINIRENGESRSIVLTSGSRKLCRIDLWCEDNNNKTKTVIHVFAQK